MMNENLSLSTLLDKVAAPILICENHTIVFANPAAEKLVGYSEAQLLDLSVDSLIYTSSSKAFSNWYAQRMVATGNESLDVRLTLVDNSLIWVRLTAEAVLFEGKSAQLITLQDITQIRKTETELYLSKAYRDMLMTNNSDVVVITDGDGNVNYVSPSMESALGYPADATLSHFWHEWVHPDDIKLVLHTVKEVREQQKCITVELRLRNINGEYIWFESMIGLVLQIHDDQLTIISAARNIHKHKLTELALREREQRLRLITDNMLDIVLEIAPDGLIRYISPSCLSIMGYQAEELIAHSHLEQVHPDDVPAVLEYFSQAMILPSRTSLELRFKHKDGRYLWVEIVYNLVNDEAGNFQSIVISVREISKRRQAQVELQQSQHLLQQIVETAPTGIYLFDVLTKQCIFYNQNGILGYSETDIKAAGDNFFEDRVHPEDRAIFDDTGTQLRQSKAGEVIVSECRMKHANGEWCWVQYHDTVFSRDKAGMPTQYLRTGYEITERKIAEEALHQNEHMLQQITDVAPVGIYIYDVKKGRDVYHNQRVVDESPIDPVTVKPEMDFYADYVHPDEREYHRKHQERLLQAKDGEIIDSENRIRLDDGSYRWFYFRDTVFKRDADGKPSQFLGAMQDITERKQSEQALRQSQDLLKKITDTAPFGVYIYDVKKRRDIYHNKRLVEEINPQELSVTPEGDFYAEYVHPDDLKIHAEHQQDLMEARDGEVIESELRARNREGQYEWLYFRDIVFARDEEGKPIQFLGSMQDITERKLAEQTLHDNQNLLKQITETVPLGIYIYDIDLKRNVFFNRTENMGYTLEYLNNQPSGDFFATLVHLDDLEVHRENIKHLMTARDGELLHNEYRMKHASGEWRWYDFRDLVFARHADGTPRQFLGSIQDITARKQTEAALLQSQQVLQQVTSTVPLDIYIFDVDLNKSVFINHRSNLGYDDHEAGNNFFNNLVHPDDMALCEDFNRRLATSADGDYVEGEFRMRHADGTWIWRNYRNIVLHRHADGTPSQYLGTVEDITQRKNIEAALRQSQHRFQQVTETVPIQIFIYDYDLQRNIFENRPSDLGFDANSLSHDSAAFFTDLIHPDDRPNHDAIMDKLLKAADGEMLENEFRMRAADGTYAWRNYRYTPFARRADGTLSQFLGTVLNVDERKKVSDALRENEEKLRLITDNIHDLVALTDETMHYRYVSPSHSRVLGYEPEVLMGKSIFELVHPDDVEMLRSKILTAIEKRQPDTAEFRFRHHDGYYLWLETNSSLALDNKGEFSGTILASRDVSERRWMQRAMLEQEKLLVMLQKEQELSSLKTRMMSRLSHELRTPLAVISTSADLLDLYGKRMTENQRTERLQQIKAQVKHFTSMLDNISLVVKGISYSMDFAPSPYNLETTAISTINDLK
ncbi:MAG: PAS domain S-box protein, partial [Anaerolineae bacterium]|nr:PAS domain S-box protein [Anaerolineae bacterium]